MSRLLCAVCIILALPGVRVAKAGPEKVQAPDGCPTMTHVPLVTVVRGDPATVVATIECPTGTVLSVQVFLRITDAGKSTPIDMEGKGDGTYQAVIPISLIRGINRFWYYIDARGKSTPDQAEEGVAQTRWYPVTIVDGGANSGGAGGAIGGGSAGGGGGGNNTLLWILAGAGAVGGGVLLENHNDDGGSGGGAPPPGNPPPVPSGNNDEDDEDEEEEASAPPEPPAPAPCIPTGSAYASSASACDTNSTIEIYVCSSCPDSFIEISASWGPSISFGGYNGGCQSEPPPAADLPQPPGVPSVTVGQYSITVRANGVVIDTISWPDSGYSDCNID